MTPFCTACGTPRQTGQRFCTGCGVAADPAPTWVPPTPPTGRPTGRVVAAITAVVLVVGGGSLAAWVLLAPPAPTLAATAPRPPATQAPVTQPPVTQPPVTQPPAAQPSATVPVPDPVTADPVPATPTQAAGPSAVALAGAAADQPAAAQVQDLLTRHFAAINALDYPAWVSTVTPARAKDQTSDTWSRGYRTSHDSDVAITAIDPVDAQTVTVHVSFVSTQDPQDAPADLRVGRICWTQQIPVSGVGTDPRLGLPPKGTSTRTAC